MIIVSNLCTATWYKHWIQKHQYHAQIALQFYFKTVGRTRNTIRKQSLVVGLCNFHSCLLLALFCQSQNNQIRYSYTCWQCSNLISPNSLYPNHTCLLSKTFGTCLIKTYYLYSFSFHPHLMGNHFCTCMHDTAIPVLLVQLRWQVRKTVKLLYNMLTSKVPTRSPTHCQIGS